MAVTKTTIDAAHCPSRLIQTCQIIAQPVTAGGFKGPNQSDNVSFSEFFYESIEHGLKAHRQLCSKSQQYSREETWWTVHPLLGHCLITLFLSDVGGQASDHQFVLIIRSAMKGTEVHQLGNLRMPWWRRCLVCMMKPGDMMVTLQHPLSGCRLHYISPPRAGGVLSAQLLQLDSKMVMTKFKFGVGYLPRHDMDRSSTFENVLANDLEEAQNMPFYQTLLSMLGEIQSIYGRVHKYCGGLDCNDQNSRAILREIQDNDGDRIEICFHVAHLLPHLSHDLVYVDRKRYLGNDIVLVLFRDSEHIQFDFKSIRSKQVKAVIMVEPQLATTVTSTLQGFKLSIYKIQPYNNMVTTLEPFLYLSLDQDEQFIQTLIRVERECYKARDIVQRLQGARDHMIREFISSNNP